MGAPHQLPVTSGATVTSSRMDLKRIVNSNSASSSSPHIPFELPCVSSSPRNYLEGTCSRRTKRFPSRDRFAPSLCTSLRQKGGIGRGGAAGSNSHGGYLNSRKTKNSLDHIDSSNFAGNAFTTRRDLLSVSVRCAAASDETIASGNEREVSLELPLFPLPLVLFPGAILPLQIFEFRYRIMMHTLLQTDLRFGVVYTDKISGMAGVGCVGEVVKHERLVDDRFFMICKGQERFRVVDIVRTKPYVVARVEWLEDRPSDEQADVEALADEVESYMKDVIRLSNRVNGKPEKTPPEDLRKKLFPTPFSFWVGSTFEGAPVEQQALLELEDTAQRLRREKETLRNTLNYLSAASAVKDVFPFSE